MKSKHRLTRNQIWFLSGLGLSVLIAVCLSPFASQNPDGLDRVASDLQFDQKALPVQPSQKLPFHSIFDEYALRGTPKPLATPLAGLLGTLGTFGLAWGMGKLFVRGSQRPKNTSQE